MSARNIDVAVHEQGIAITKCSALSTLLFAGLTVGLLGSAAPAQMADFDQLQKSVTVGLASIQVNTDNLGLLTMSQIAQLSGILEQDGTNETKALAANTVIEQAVNPVTFDMNSAAGMAMLDVLKSNLDRVGVKYSGLEGLTHAQAQQLTQVFEHYNDDDAQAKQSAEAIIVAIGMPGDVPTANAGVVQLEEQVRAKLAALGLTPPAKGTLTFAQVGSLTAIFDQQGSSEAEQKAKAMTVLGLN